MSGDKARFYCVLTECRLCLCGLCLCGLCLCSCGRFVGLGVCLGVLVASVACSYDLVILCLISYEQDYESS